jgi:Ring finger domain
MMNNNNNNNEAHDNDCAICLSSLGQRNSCVTECGHSFCLSCLLQAVQRKPDCPLCRQMLVAPAPAPASAPDNLFAYWSNNSINNNNVVNIIPTTTMMENNNHNNMFAFSFDDELFPSHTNNNNNNNIDNTVMMLENATPYEQTTQERWQEQMLFANMQPLEPFNDWMDLEMPELVELAESMTENVLSEQDWINQHPMRI